MRQRKERLTPILSKNVFMRVHPTLRGKTKNMYVIAYATQSGQAKNLAHSLYEELHALKPEFFLTSMEEYSLDDLYQDHTPLYLIIVTSTYGDGEPPDSGAAAWLEQTNVMLQARESLLRPTNLAVLGIGDRYYPHFCQCAQDFDQNFQALGAVPIIPLLKVEVSEQEQIDDWLTQLKNSL
jgi:sulfite reductase (NADPH) flavoprotein alpha-component